MPRSVFEFPAEPLYRAIRDHGGITADTDRTSHTDEDVREAYRLMRVVADRDGNALSLEEADWFACTILNMHPGLIWGDLYWDGPPKPEAEHPATQRCAACRRWGLTDAQRKGASDQVKDQYVTISRRGLCSGCYLRMMGSGHLEDWPSVNKRHAKTGSPKPGQPYKGTTTPCRSCDRAMVSKYVWKRLRPSDATYLGGRGLCVSCYAKDLKASKVSQ